MGFSRFHTGMALRTAALFFTIVAIAWMITHTQWYVTITLCLAALIAEVAILTRFATESSREVARFLDAISFDDTMQTFPKLSRDSAYRDLGAAITRVLEMLRAGRSEREEQRRYLQILIAHVPVALLSTDEQGGAQLLNAAARRMFERPLSETSQFTRHGEAFAIGMESLRPGGTVIVRMERTSGSLQLKAASTELILGGVRRRLISLQNIENEMSAQEMVAWQTVMRVMAHEVMNSLTPVSSLSATAHQRIREVLAQIPAEDPRAAEGCL
jgi:two-component system nitrogen regulation sensor histidine kinase NtrY